MKIETEMENFIDSIKNKDITLDDDARIVLASCLVNYVKKILRVALFVKNSSETEENGKKKKNKGTKRITLKCMFNSIKPFICIHDVGKGFEKNNNVHEKLSKYVKKCYEELEDERDKDRKERQEKKQEKEEKKKKEEMEIEKEKEENEKREKLEKLEKKIKKLEKKRKRRDESDEQEKILSLQKKEKKKAKKSKK